MLQYVVSGSTGNVNQNSWIIQHNEYLMGFGLTFNIFRVHVIVASMKCKGRFQWERKRLKKPANIYVKLACTPELDEKIHTLLCVQHSLVQLTFNRIMSYSH